MNGAEPWWKSLWNRLRGRPSAQGLSDMLPLPTWEQHPFSQSFGSVPAWYALLVPTIEEGHEVLEALPRLLAPQRRDFAILVAFSVDDSTRGCIEEAALLEPRIIPVIAGSNRPDSLEVALTHRLSDLEQQRGQKVTDALIIPLPELQIKRL